MKEFRLSLPVTIPPLLYTLSLPGSTQIVMGLYGWVLYLFDLARV